MTLSTKEKNNERIIWQCWCNNLKFEYIGPNKDVSFYECKDSKELFHAIKNNQIKFDEVKNKQNEFLNKLSNIKIGIKTDKQKGN